MLARQLLLLLLLRLQLLLLLMLLMLLLLLLLLLRREPSQSGRPPGLRCFGGRRGWARGTLTLKRLTPGAVT